MSTSLPDGPVVEAATASRVSCGSSTVMKPVNLQALITSAVLRHRTVPSGLAAQSTTSHSLSAHPNPKSGNEERRFIAKKPKTLLRYAVACVSKLKNPHPRRELHVLDVDDRRAARPPECAAHFAGEKARLLHDGVDLAVLNIGVSSTSLRDLNGTRGDKNLDEEPGAYRGYLLSRP
ncbi:hypothetical protein SUNI508_09488 [Seiridium unicorne]|uniref:Uncharacterized protein n=1 Tax=Seiridium unicorne TaxID=138068 RepID=A0ABR2UQZ5_9PEZI